MAFQATRGTKRRCLNPECGLPFYDLNRNAFACPSCGTDFDVEAANRAKLAALAPPRAAGRRGGRYFPAAEREVVPVAASDAIDDPIAADATEVLDDVDVEVDAPADEAEETAGVEPILEQEEDEIEVVIDLEAPREKDLDE